MRYLLKDGKPLYILGINYWARSEAILMWRHWKPDEVAAEIKQMKDLGLNVCRSFLFMPDFMPQPGLVDPVMLDRLDQFFRFCREAGILTMPSFFVGHMSGEDWDVPWRGGRNIYNDPWMLMQENLYVQTVAKRYRNEPALLAWILSNEITNWGGNTDDQSAWLWASTMTNAIHEVDSDHPVSPGDGAWQAQGYDNGFRLEVLKDVVDFFGPHTYLLESDALRHSNIPSFLIKLTQLGKPTLLEEFGCSTAHASYQHQADYYRTTLHSVLLSGGAGAMGWCYTDFTLPGLRPYSHNTFELEFGITTAAGEPKPVAEEFKRLSRILDRIDLAEYSPRPAQAGIVVPSYYDWHYPYPFLGWDPVRMRSVMLEAFTISKQAHLAVDLVREPVIPWESAESLKNSQGLEPPEGMKLLIVANPPALTAPTWDSLFKFVEAGGTLYCSYHTAMWVYNFEKLFGCRHNLRFGLVDMPEETVEITFTRQFGPIKADETLGYRVLESPDCDRYTHQPWSGNRLNAYCPVEPATAEVIAHDERGRPALLLNRIGKGQVVFCTYPIEHYLASTPDAHSEDYTYLLYEGLRDLAGIVPAFASDNPCVELGSLAGEAEEILWVINHSWKPASGRIVTTLHVEDVVDFETGDDAELVFDLPPKGVKVLSVRLRK